MSLKRAFSNILVDNIKSIVNSQAFKMSALVNINK